MKTLLISTAYNGLTQRAHPELAARGHEVFVELAISDAQMTEAVALVKPDLVTCPFLKSRLPEAIWRNTRSIIIHPGIVGDRGPSALDWAIHNVEPCWGVTAIEANDELDAGDVWATETFELRTAPKASIYRQEVTDAAIRCILKTIERVRAGERPTPLHLMRGQVKGRLGPRMTQADRAIDWQHDSTLAVIRKIHAADSFPGVLGELCGLEVHLYGVHEEGLHRGRAGDIVAQRMRMDFNGPAYEAARKAFVYKEVPIETPSHLAPHRQRERAGAKWSPTFATAQCMAGSNAPPRPCPAWTF